MAEAAFSVANNLGRLLHDEDIFPDEDVVRADVVGMKRVLERLRDVAYEASSPVLRDESALKLVNMIRDVAYAAEDVVEDFIFKVKQQNEQEIRYDASEYTIHHKNINNIHMKIREIQSSSPYNDKPLNVRPYEIFIRQYGKPLESPDASLQLLMNCAFSNIVVDFHGDIYHISLKKEKNVHHPELFNPAKQIIEMCDHRPIILMAIGNILSSRMQTPTEWQKVANRISWALPVNSNEWSNVYRLVIAPERYPWQTYYKSLLYFGIFSRDHIIDAKTLTRLWVAEDFIQPTRWKTAEEVAEEYLEELIRRNIVEIVTVNSVGGVETCRIQKLFQVFCTLNAENIRFFGTDPSTNARRLVICKTTTVEEKLVIKNQPDPQNLQTLLAFEPDAQQLECLYHGQPRLKVLHCEGHILRSLKIGGMHLLRYLDIKYSGTEDDLYNISHLHHLQTLSVDFCYGYDRQVKLVIDMSQLRKLRHLILLHTSYLGEISLNGLEAANGLRTLVGVNAGDWIESSLHKLTNLRTLKMKGCKYSHGEALAKSLVQMKRLVTLHLVGEGGSPSLPTLSDLVHLIELEMGNPLSCCNLNEPVPQSHKELPPRLKKLTLWRCQPTHYPMEFLGNLESLQALHLYEDRSHLVDDEVWHMKRGNFPNLQVLELVGVKRVVEWIIDEGALSRLHQLSILGCQNLKTLPHGLKNISTLRRLELSNSFEERIKEGTGEDWDEVKHVPEIDARYVDLDENRDLRLQ